MGPALLDPPEDRPGRRGDEVSRPLSEVPRARRERPRASAGAFTPDEDTEAFLRTNARSRRIRRGLIPQTRIGRITAGIGMAAFFGLVATGSLYAMRFLHRAPQFLIPSSANIELQGNQHLSRSQLLSIFGEDVERNIFDIPLAERRAQLEQMPWVEHATIMRLLPDHLRVQVKERTPVAFIRQGGTIGMADANGVLLDIPPDAPGDPNYSFPVVTGLKAEDTPESREQRMHLYTEFLKDLDSGQQKISSELSEVDLSDPEDVKALIPDGGSEVLVHFGTGSFLPRYKRFREHVSEWKSQYPRLSGVDMRYERQVVLQMPPKDSLPVAGGGPETATQPPAPVTVAKVSVPKPRSETSIPVSAHHSAPMAKQAGSRSNAIKRAEMAKRVEAVKVWMAHRQQTRNAKK